MSQLQCVLFHSPVYTTAYQLTRVHNHPSWRLHNAAATCYVIAECNSRRKVGMSMETARSGASQQLERMCRCDSTCQAISRCSKAPTVQNSNAECRLRYVLCCVDLHTELRLGYTDSGDVLGGADPAAYSLVLQGGQPTLPPRHTDTSQQQWSGSGIFSPSIQQQHHTANRHTAPPHHTLRFSLACSALSTSHPLTSLDTTPSVDFAEHGRVSLSTFSVPRPPCLILVTTGTTAITLATPTTSSFHCTAALGLPSRARKRAPALHRTTKRSL